MNISELQPHSKPYSLERLENCTSPTWGYKISAIQIVGYCLAFSPILTITLNVIAMGCIVRAPKLKAHTRVFLVSLAICDALVGALVIPFRLMGIFTADLYDVKNLLSDTLCDVGNSFDVMLCTSSVMHISVLAYDRFLATCHPFKLDYWFSRKFLTLFLVLSWMLPAVISFGFIPSRIYVRDIERQHECHQQTTGACQFTANVSYSLTTVVICFIVPASFIILCNYRIMKTVRKRTELFNKLLQINTKRRSFDRRHFGTKLARTIFIMTVCFVCCWLPFFIIEMIDPFISYRVPAYIWLLVTWLGYANSAINPVLYLKSTGHLSLQ